MATVARPITAGLPGYSETMPCEAASARRARLLVTAALSCWGIHGLVEDAVLIVDELLSNAVDHTNCRSARVVVRRVSESRVRIGVADTSRDVPDMHQAGDDALGPEAELLRRVLDGLRAAA